MPDLHYEHPRLAGLYDLACGWSEDRDFYLSLADGGPKSILDLGCGTGLICDAYAARGHDVTGADPSAPMLDIAKRKPHGDRIEWVECYSQDFRSEKRFDLIIMTGHAFQVLLDERSILATFAAMREHLADGGCIVFETRNPEIDWKARWDGGAFEVVHGGACRSQDARRGLLRGGADPFRNSLSIPRRDACLKKRAAVFAVQRYRTAPRGFRAARRSRLWRLGPSAFRPADLRGDDLRRPARFVSQAARHTLKQRRAARRSRLPRCS
nr:class I SAM-dependent methyltransferase [Rhizobium sp. BK538]